MSVSVREGTSLDILSRKSHIITVFNESSEGEGLGSSPIDALAGLDALQTGLEDFLDLSVEFLVLRQLGNLMTSVLKAFNSEAGDLSSRLVDFLDTLPLVGDPVFSIESVVLGVVVGRLKSVLDALSHLSAFFGGYNALVDELLLVDSSHRGHLGNLLVHLGLGEAGLIELVVTEFTVTNEIDDDIMIEFLSVLGSQLEHEAHVIHAVGVNVEDGSVDSLGEVRGIDTGAGHLGASSESDLVVHDDVDGASNLVVLQILHLDALVAHALAGEGSISVDQHRDNSVTILSLLNQALKMVLCSSSSHNNGVDALQVRGVSEHLDGELLAIAVSSGEAGSKMVLDITR
mmetsp:Transcript_24212/g.37290  ORF Transcript_24212/g.37290 Transcript_24212/m.37290 type:complete len:345 (+) Transcript_24212:1000-2034(+)